MMRREVIFEIGQLELNHCLSCSLVKTFPANAIALECVKNCDIGKKLMDLGKQLGGTGTIRTRYYTEPFTKEDYMHLKSLGKTEKEIAKELNCSRKALYYRRCEWGLVHV